MEKIPFYFYGKKAIGVHPVDAFETVYDKNPTLTVEQLCKKISCKLAEEIEIYGETYYCIGNDCYGDCESFYEKMKRLTLKDCILSLDGKRSFAKISNAKRIFKIKNYAKQLTEIDIYNKDYKAKMAFRPLAENKIKRNQRLEKYKEDILKQAKAYRIINSIDSKIAEIEKVTLTQFERLMPNVQKAIDKGISTLSILDLTKVQAKLSNDLFRLNLKNTVYKNKKIKLVDFKK